jgi:hypothetical protein
MTPVTTYRQACYYEPVTTCCTPACPPPCPSSCTSTAPACNGSGAAPGITENRDPAPGISETRDPGSATESRKISPAPKYMPNANDAFYRQPTPAGDAPARVRFDRIAALSGQNLTGSVVSNDRAPRGNARVLFVSAEKKGGQEAVYADKAGNFKVKLTAGEWLVYVTDASGKPVFTRRVTVEGKVPMKLTLVSR